MPGIIQTSFQNQINAVNSAIEDMKSEVDNFIAGAETTIKGWWDSIFYVDAVNGDDSNPGTLDAPFKTIKKAVDSVPVGGRGKIFMIGSGDITNPVSYNIDETIALISKHIDILSYAAGSVIVPSVISNETYNFVCGFALHNATLNINTAGGNIVLKNALKANADLPFEWRNSALINILGDSSVKIGGYPTAEGIRLKNGGCHLINICLRDANASIGNVAFSFVKAVFDDTTPDSMLVSIYSSDANCVFADYNLFLLDVNGNSVPLPNVISGIVKDVNGIPRNIISNKIL